MIRNSDTWALLQRLEPTKMTSKYMTPLAKEKARETSHYSLRQDPSQNEQDVLRRNLVAMMAEQIVMNAVHGFMPTGRENHENPWSFAYDVVGKDGVRIEVKTHQTDSKYITVNTGMSGDYPATSWGINLGPFLGHKLADLIIIFDTKQDATGATLFTPKYLAGRDAFVKDSGLVIKSQYNDGWYLSSRPYHMEDFNFHQFTQQI
ncbi:DNA endonuclease IV [Edwardsiella phage PEi26]|uniref:DNA endonuclease IV n=2 Tax=Kanagawavirus pei20 TaxID=2844109 RepID=A0A0B6VPN5_9CAUD|nr:DNA endonuclease IV [Edwardsiella phage PEi26]